MTLAEKRVMTLDLPAMVAGTKYRGDFEERIRSVIEEVAAAGDVILFVDEIHTIMGIGAAEGAVDAANMMKPKLARGELQVIGATTIAEYRKTIEKDGALARRFQSVLVEEPTEEQALAIMQGLRSRYEQHHEMLITDEALEAAVRLSMRYFPTRFLPDKAIDLLDEAAARLRIEPEGNGFCGAADGAKADPDPTGNTTGGRRYDGVVGRTETFGRAAGKQFASKHSGTAGGSGDGHSCRSAQQCGSSGPQTPHWVLSVFGSPAGVEKRSFAMHWGKRCSAARKILLSWI